MTVVAAENGTFFEDAAVPPHGGRTKFSLDFWEKTRNAGIEPQFHSGYSDDPKKRLEFLAGADLMGLRLEDYDPKVRMRELTDPEFGRQRKMERRAAGYFDQLLPQQLQIADTLNMDRDAFGIEIPRRATKTTSIFCLLLGRCATRPGHQVTFSAQNGVAGSRRLREWAQRLDAVNPPDDQDLPPWLRGRPRVTKRHQRQIALFGDDLIEEQLEEGRRGFRIMRGEVGKGIYFENGSTFLVLKPDADAYRGEGADDSWIDEGQEIDPSEGDDLLAAILPLQDTKPGASIIVSGTAGEARVGPFWSYVDRGRSGNPDVGTIDFAAPENTDWDEVNVEESAMELLATIHPGIGTLTTIEKMRKNYRSMQRPQWAREYLSMWPETMGISAIPAGQWQAAIRKTRPRRPARVAFGLDIRPGGSVGAICAAWRDSKGIAYVELIAHEPGTLWIPKRAQELMKYQGATIAYDDIAEGKATATEMATMRPKPRMRLQTYREHAAGCVQLLRDLDRGKLRHFDQLDMNAAAAIVTKREVRSENGVWLWGAGAAGGDISPIVAATRALRNWDQHFARRNGGSGFTPIMGS